MHGNPKSRVVLQKSSMKKNKWEWGGSECQAGLPVRPWGFNHRCADLNSLASSSSRSGSPICDFNRSTINMCLLRKHYKDMIIHICVYYVYILNLLIYIYTYSIVIHVYICIICVHIDIHIHIDVQTCGCTVDRDPIPSYWSRHQDSVHNKYPKHLKKDWKKPDYICTYITYNMYIYIYLLLRIRIQSIHLHANIFSRNIHWLWFDFFSTWEVRKITRKTWSLHRC